MNKRTLMLELGRVSCMHRHSRAVYMQLSNQRRRLARELGSEGLATALTESQQTNEDVLTRIFICKEGLPASVCDVVSSHQLHLARINTRVDALDTYFTRTHIATRQTEVLHALQHKFAEVTVLDTRRHQRHGNIALNAVDTCPGRHVGHHLGEYVHERVRRVVLVATRLIQFVKTSATNDQGRVKLHTISCKQERTR